MQDQHDHRPLTIGMFTDTYLPEINGVVTSVVSSAAALRRRGHRVIVVAPSHGEHEEDGPDVFRLRSTSFPFYPELRMAFPLPAKLVATLPRVPFDVIHTHSFFFIGCLGAYLARLRRVPLFFTYHTRLADYSHYIPVHQRVTKTQAVWISREFSNRCDRIIAPTEEIVALLREYGVQKPISVIPSGFDPRSFDSEGPAPPSIADARPAHVLLYVGRIGKEKNLDLLIDAFAKVAEKRGDVRLVVVGEGPYRPELEERSAALKDRVTFVGEISQWELGRYYRHADIFVFTSKTETQGLVLVEAMAHGLPVVAVDCPVTREVVAGEAGVLTSENVELFSEELSNALDEPAPQRALRQQAARKAAAPFTVDALTADLDRLYRKTFVDLAMAR